MHLLTQIELGQRIRRARERLHMLQKDFAAAVSKDATAISEYETGKRKISAVELSVFAQVLQVPVSYFYEDEIQFNEIQPNELEHLLLDEFRKLPTLEAKQVMLQMLQVLSSLLRQHPSDE